ncbi:MAG: hypothetical protein M1114_05285 [Candidatus Dependentiae bacterium]|nr:hypothetical protein [Candidatus Dependentiae bacterium]
MNHFKKFFLVITIVVVTNNLQAASNKDLLDFNKGQNFRECIKNCRHKHQSELNLPLGYGEGLCWDECEQAYNLEENI